MGLDEENKTPVSAYAHVSEARVITDQKVNLKRHYSVGQSVTCRVISLNNFDGIANVPLNTEVIKQRFVTVNEVKAGMLVTAEVDNIASHGIYFYLSPRVKALCPNVHLTDGATEEIVQTKKWKKNIEGQFKQGKHF